MKVDLFMLIGKMLNYSKDNEIEIEINKDWFKKKGFEEFKLRFTNCVSDEECTKDVSEEKDGKE